MLKERSPSEPSAVVRKERASELTAEFESSVEMKKESKVKERALDEPSAVVRKESRLEEIEGV